MPDFTVHRHPILAVRCPTCAAAVGNWCRRPIGHRAGDLHADRRAEADRAFIEQHGADAAIRRDAESGEWWIEGSQRSCAEGMRP